jgi:hypothetical protein
MRRSKSAQQPAGEKWRTSLRIKDFGYQIDRDLSIEEDPKGEHNEITWGRHLPHVLEFFFAA